MAATTKIWINGTAPTCAAEDLNGFKNEQNVAIESSDQVLNTGNNNQTAITHATYSHDGNFYTDSGAVNAYVLAPANAARKAPIAYTDGMFCRFRPSASNTGAATVNVSSIGVKNIVTETGGALSGGEFLSTSEVFLTYSLSLDAFILTAVSRDQDKPNVGRGYIDGLRTENAVGDSAHDIRCVGGGVCRSIDDAITITAAGSTDITKRIDAVWSEGNAVGGRASGISLTANTWFRVFIISKDDGVSVDFGFDIAFDASALLADAVGDGYKYARQIAWVLTNASSNIIGYEQLDDDFTWDNMISDSTGNSASSTRASIQVSAPPQSYARMNFRTWSTGALATSTYILVTETRQKNYTQPDGGNFTEQLFPGTLLGAGYGVAHEIKRWVDPSSLVWVDADRTDTEAKWAIRTIGFRYKR